MTPWEWVLLCGLATVGSPLFVYLCVRMGRLGWLRGTQYYTRQRMSEIIKHALEEQKNGRQSP